MPSKFAYFTLVSNDFVIGAKTMIKSLRQHTSRPIEVLVLDDVSETDVKALEALGAICQRVDRIGSKLAIVQPWHKSPDFCQNCFAKINMWNTDYDKIIYLDADILILKSIDHLFYTEEDFAAARATTSVIDTSKSVIKHSFLNDKYFNAGVLVLTPNKETYADLMEQKDILNNHEGSDQSFLNIYFQHTWKRLPQIYNASKRLKLVMPEKWQDIENDICIIHYALDKPWLNPESTDVIDRLWWLWSEVSEEYKTILDPAGEHNL